MYQFKKEMPGPPVYTPCYHIKVHGGLGDIIWSVGKKLSNADLPIFLSISEENRYRPRRSGILADHLPNCIGWRFDGLTFASGGRDWPSPGDPSCAVGKTWDEIKPTPSSHTPLRLECNYWLELGKRLEDWLPDLPTTHHFAFEPADPPQIKFKTPYVILHLAGWPDVADEIWVSAARLFYNTAHVYIVGGSYDNRPRRVADLAKSRGGVTLFEDLPWPDLFALVGGCEYCFGHASGFTALADVLRCRGVVVNPRSVPRLTGTWNSLENPDLVYVDGQEDFSSAVFTAASRMAGRTNTWPPTTRRGCRITATGADPRGPVLATAAAVAPRNVLVAAAGEHPDWLASSALAGVYSAGRVVDSVTTIGCRVEAVAALIKESLRSTRRAAIRPLQTFRDYTIQTASTDLAVVYAGISPADGFRLAVESWRRLGPNGTLLVGGPYAESAARAVCGPLRVEPSAVSGPETGWFYVHKRV